MVRILGTALDQTPPTTKLEGVKSAMGSEQDKRLTGNYVDTVTTIYP
jgi:hypothetical protein